MHVFANNKMRVLPDSMQFTRKNKMPKYAKTTTFTYIPGTPLEVH